MTSPASYRQLARGTGQMKLRLMHNASSRSPGVAASMQRLQLLAERQRAEDSKRASAREAQRWRDRVETESLLKTAASFAFRAP